MTSGDTGSDAADTVKSTRSLYDGYVWNSTFHPRRAASVGVTTEIHGY
jgi:hypothetical protein